MKKPKPKPKNKKSFWFHDAAKITVYVVDEIPDDGVHHFDAYCVKTMDDDVEIYYKPTSSLLVLIHEAMHAMSFVCGIIGEEDITLAEAFTGEVMTYEMSEFIHKILLCYFDITDKMKKEEEENKEEANT